MNWLGKLSLLLSLFCVLMTLGLKLAFSGWMPYVSVGFGFGLFFFFFALLINFHFVKSLIRSESLHFILKSSLVSVLVFLGLLFANIIFAHQNLRFDVTTNKINSLPKLTRALIRALPDDLQFYYFHTGNNKVRGFEGQVREKLQPYLALSSKLHLQSFNVFKRPDLAEKFKVGDEESSLFAEFKGRITRVSNLDETAITNALLKLTKPAKKIYFVETNGERKIADKNTFGLNGLKKQLERLHYKVENLESLTSVPEDTALLVIAGPRRKLTQESKNILHSYLEGGGALFIALDPGEENDFGSFLNHYGIHFTNHFVFSSQAQATQSNLLTLTHGGKGTHEISRTLQQGQNPALFMASILENIDDDEGRYKISPLLEHLPNSIVREGIDEKSKVVTKSSKYVGLLSEGVGESLYRLAVVGDSDFLTNQFYTRPGNFDFALGVFTYLSKDEDLLKLKIPVAKTTYLILTQTQMNLYFIFFIFPLALLFFIVALFFKLRRLF